MIYLSGFRRPEPEGAVRAPSEGYLAFSEDAGFIAGDPAGRLAALDTESAKKRGVTKAQATAALLEAQSKPLREYHLERERLLVEIGRLGEEAFGEPDIAVGKGYSPEELDVKVSISAARASLSKALAEKIATEPMRKRAAEAQAALAAARSLAKRYPGMRGRLRMLDSTLSIAPTLEDFEKYATIESYIGDIFEGAEKTSGEVVSGIAEARKAESPDAYAKELKKRIHFIDCVGEKEFWTDPEVSEARKRLVSTLELLAKGARPELGQMSARADAILMYERDAASFVKKTESLLDDLRLLEAGRKAGPRTGQYDLPGELSFLEGLGLAMDGAGSRAEMIIKAAGGSRPRELRLVLESSEAPLAEYLARAAYREAYSDNLLKLRAIPLTDVEASSAISPRNRKAMASAYKALIDKALLRASIGSADGDAISDAARYLAEKKAAPDSPRRREGFLSFARKYKEAPAGKRADLALAFLGGTDAATLYAEGFTEEKRRLLSEIAWAYRERDGALSVAESLALDIVSPGSPGADGAALEIADLSREALAAASQGEALAKLRELAVRKGYFRNSKDKVMKSSLDLVAEEEGGFARAVAASSKAAGILRSSSPEDCDSLSRWIVSNYAAEAPSLGDYVERVVGGIEAPINAAFRYFAGDIAAESLDLDLSRLPAEAAGRIVRRLSELRSSGSPAESAIVLESSGSEDASSMLYAGAEPALKRMAEIYADPLRIPDAAVADAEALSRVERIAARSGNVPPETRELAKKALQKAGYDVLLERIRKEINFIDETEPGAARSDAIGRSADLLGSRFTRDGSQLSQAAIPFMRTKEEILCLDAPLAEKRDLLNRAVAAYLLGGSVKGLLGEISYAGETLAGEASSLKGASPELVGEIVSGLLRGYSAGPDVRRALEHEKKRVGSPMVSKEGLPQGEAIAIAGRIYKDAIAIAGKLEGAPDASIREAAGYAALLGKGFGSEYRRRLDIACAQSASDCGISLPAFSGIARKTAADIIDERAYALSGSEPEGRLTILAAADYLKSGGERMQETLTMRQRQAIASRITEEIAGRSELSFAEAAVFAAKETGKDPLFPLLYDICVEDGTGRYVLPAEAPHANLREALSRKAVFKPTIFYEATPGQREPNAVSFVRYFGVGKAI